MESQIRRIKEHLSITRAWELLNLPGKPGSSTRSPLRPDKRPSFSIYRQGQWERWYDHGLGVGGDVVDLWAAVRKITVPEAITEILAAIPALALDPGAFKPPAATMSHRAPQNAPEGQTRSVRWPPDIRLPTQNECRELSSLRSLPAGAFDLASHLGTLRVCSMYRQKSWLLTDARGLGGEGRRFDGAWFDQKRKGCAIVGSDKSWPVGLQTSSSDLDASGNILLVEGMPDYFAALALGLQSEISFRPAAMLGAEIRTIHKDAAPYLKGARVIILPHNDLCGGQGATRWVKELLALGACKVVVQPLPFEHNDLNDFISTSPDNAPQLLKGFE